MIRFTATMKDGIVTIQAILRAFIAPLPSLPPTVTEEKKIFALRSH
jgi:hypothetical protein